MNRQEADEVIRRVGNTWGSPVDPGLVDAWHVSLAPVSYSVARETIERLKLARPSPPGPPVFVEACAETAAMGRRGSSPRIGPRRNCPLCGGTGWREVVTQRGQHGDVVRCSCAGPPDHGHPKGCTCRECIDPEGADLAKTKTDDELRFVRYPETML